MLSGMRFSREILNVAFLTLALASVATAVSLDLPQGFKVDGTVLRDINDQPLVMRGVNVSHTWFPEHTYETLERASAMGCNTVRIVISNGEQWNRTSPDELNQVLNWCERFSLVAVVEIHDATGYGDKPGAANPLTAVEYWLDEEIFEVLRGTDHRVILNIANEPFGNQGSSEWFEFHLNAIQQLRDAGYKHTLMIDGAHWGQDSKGLMLEKGPELLESDPERNVMFSVHMYEWYPTEQEVHTYLQRALDQNLCIIVGEFGMEHNGKPVAAEAILLACEQWDLGYLGWSWSGNNEAVAQLDLVIDFDATQLSPWGELLFDHPEAGIRASSRKADIFFWY